MTFGEINRNSKPENFPRVQPECGFTACRAGGFAIENGVTKFGQRLLWMWLFVPLACFRTN